MPEFIFDADDGEPDDGEYDLIMPFVTVQSKDGPHEDVSYVAGYEMGYLDAALDGSKKWAKTSAWTIHAENRAQADLIAMHHGYTLEVTDSTTADGWIAIVLTKADADA